ncbi:hypothetical protein NYE40_23890 [Paenibacillus sp. FSL W8-1187]|uniref:hypothetical protein n=1 Tax=Paenibacillus sp. FSL W8-1187 TaxID=2975339 RepID=UPI0030DA9E20
MKLASFYKNSLVPSYERINIISSSVIEVVNTSQQTIPDPDLVDDARPFTRRQAVMNSILKKVNSLPKKWRMSAKKRKAGGNFDYVVVHFEDLNLNLVPVHLLSHSKLPKPNRYRGDISAFNFAVMKERGMLSEIEFQSFMDFDQEPALVTEPRIPSNLKDIPFGLLLVYDGTNPKAPVRLAALTPDQDQYIFCDNVELLKEYSSQTQQKVKDITEVKKKRKLKLDTTQVKDYQDSPDIVVRKDITEGRSDNNADTV